VKRRAFIAGLCGAAAWPLLAQAQQPAQMRRIGVLMGITEDDPESKRRLTSLAQGLKQLGWTVGQNIRVDYRWRSVNADDLRRYAAELVTLAPDVILANGSAAVAALLQETHSIPIVFVFVTDPVGAGYVDSLSSPGGNVTGFTNFEYVFSNGWNCSKR
jgi:putative tryptophan/tyrosine transport system substrate-binding protein